MYVKTTEHKMKIRRAVIRLWQNPEYRRIMLKVRKEQLPGGMTGKRHTREAKIKMSLSKKGKKGRRHTDEAKRKMSLHHNYERSNGPRSPESIKKALRRRIPTSLEIKFQKIVNKYDLPYRFVGDGSFVIGHYNPDFINTNGEKIAIEVYARYFKERHSSIKGWKIGRQNTFRKYGWKLLFFDETQVNEKNILKVL